MGVEVNLRKKRQQSELTKITNLQSKYAGINSQEIIKFSDFPLSTITIKCLRKCGYLKPTDIQRETIGLALNGKDVLGAAQTGSGKTLAFLIPIIERLYVKQWTSFDGVGALVITPTRELAYQIFETLRRVGTLHDFSAGLIIGGKDLKFERTCIDQCNIIICTPGRLLQHMDENPLFNCVNLQILVLDEADRCLDMGFEKTMNAIIANLPSSRQTLLFSATQTKSVKDLGRLSLKDPSYVNVHEHFEFTTPKELVQHYIIIDLKDKISVLWSFLKNHPKQKVIVFFSTCKQVKYIFEIFCKLRPGRSLMALYGSLHQLRRMEIYESFCRKQSAILFATDLASRGLDFPEVHWVVQVDCPEDPETYIHRVGRTARYLRGGESLLMLLPSEIEIIKKLIEKKIPIQKIDVNPGLLHDPVRRMEAYLAKNPDLKESAQRAFVSYIKSVFLMKDKSVFKVEALDTNSLAYSLGLAIPPRIRFLQRMNAKKSLKVDHLENSISVDLRDKRIEKTKSNDNGVGGFCDSAPFKISDYDDDSGDDILKVKRVHLEIDPLTEQEKLELDTPRKENRKTITRAAVAKKILKKNIVPNKKIIFTEDGQVLTSGNKEKKSELAIQYELESSAGIDIETAKIVLSQEDKFDKQFFSEKVKAKHKKAKQTLKEKKKKIEESKSDFAESALQEGPDVSWLPDPETVYGKKSKKEIEDLKSNYESVAESEANLRKRKRNNRNLEKTSITPKKKGKLDKVGSSLSVKEAEQFALMLLKS